MTLFLYSDCQARYYDVKEEYVNNVEIEHSSQHSNVLLSDHHSKGDENTTVPTENGMGVEVPSDDEYDDDMVLVDTLVDDEFNPLTPGGEHKRIVSGFGVYEE